MLRHVRQLLCGRLRLVLCPKVCRGVRATVRVKCVTEAWYFPLHIVRCCPDFVQNIPRMLIILVCSEVCFEVNPVPGIFEKSWQPGCRWRVRCGKGVHRLHHTYVHTSLRNNNAKDGAEINGKPARKAAFATLGWHATFHSPDASTISSSREERQPGRWFYSAPQVLPPTVSPHAIYPAAAV